MRPDVLYVVKGTPQLNIIQHRRGYKNGSPCIFLTYQNKDRSPVEYGFNPMNVIILPFFKTDKGYFKVQTEKKEYLVNTIHIYKNQLTSYFGIELSIDNLIFIKKDNCIIASYLVQDKMVNYFQEISALSNLEDENGNTISLSQKYEKRRFLEGSIFDKYVHPEKNILLKKTDSIPFLIFPFGCNYDQWQATKNALTSDISIIQGPPGTGKTQTILNILANYIINDMTVEIVSNNNSAVSNILEKLNQYEYGFFAAMLGKKENKDNFINEQTGLYPNLSSWEREPFRQRALEKKLNQISSNLTNYFKDTRRRAFLNEKIAILREQLSDGINIKLKKRAQQIPSSKLYKLLMIIDDNFSRRGKILLRAKLLLFMYGFSFKSFDRAVFERIVGFRSLYEMEIELKSLTKKCDEFAPIYEQYKALSKEYFESRLYTIFGNKSKRTIFERDDLWRDTNSFLKEYPVILSSTFSATANINSQSQFDVIIMDEASQIDIAAGALALSCANKAVIVGDDKQLPNVVTKELKEKSDLIFKHYNIPRPYRFAGNSFLSSVQKVILDVPKTFLQEHYRCEPRIIGFCNKQFYKGKLIPMTTRAKENPMKLITTVCGNHARGHCNQRQAEEAIDEIKKLYNYKDIGIIVPYNEQAKLISNLLESNHLAHIPVSTVHKFQGRECDAIILCTVDNVIKEFVDDPHLLNVAVSRAKKHFTLIVNDGDVQNGNIKDLIEYTKMCGGNIEKGKIRSIFDVLYRQYTDEREKFIKEHIKVSEYASECLMYDLLKSIVRMPEWNNLNFVSQYPLSSLVPDECILTNEEKKYALNPWTKVDFLLYEDKANKRPVLVIEVDGMAFHAIGSTQWNRDRKKDCILQKSGLPYLRFPTNGSREKEKIILKLKQILEATLAMNLF